MEIINPAKICLNNKIVILICPATIYRFVNWQESIEILIKMLIKISDGIPKFFF